MCGVEAALYKAAHHKAARFLTAYFDASSASLPEGSVLMQVWAAAMQLSRSFVTEIAQRESHQISQSISPVVLMQDSRILCQLSRSHRRA